MPTLPLRCDRCQTAVRGAALNLPGLTPCRSCGARLQTWVFPAFFRPEIVGVLAAEIGSPEDASCFFHPRKKAVVTCERCGRFLCALCEVTINGRRLCPTCLGAGPDGRKQPLETEAVLYDHVAWMIGLWPLVFIFFLWFLWPVYVVTAGVTLYLVVRHWGAPARALIPRTQTRMALAAALAVLQLIAAAALGWLFLSGLASRLWR